MVASHVTGATVMVNASYNSLGTQAPAGVVHLPVVVSHTTAGSSGSPLVLFTQSALHRHRPAQSGQTASEIAEGSAAQVFGTTAACRRQVGGITRTRLA